MRNVKFVIGLLLPTSIMAVLIFANLNGICVGGICFDKKIHAGFIYVFNNTPDFNAEARSFPNLPEQKYVEMVGRIKRQYEIDTLNPICNEKCTILCPNFEFIEVTDIDINNDLIDCICTCRKK